MIEKVSDRKLLETTYTAMVAVSSLLGKLIGQQEQEVKLLGEIIKTNQEQNDLIEFFLKRTPTKREQWLNDGCYGEFRGDKDD